jgi:2-oxo-4-hydroxy-4-carboxy-5-ureidoimidazoline decarboxylase
MPFNIDELNQLSDPSFGARLADIFEHSPWVALRVAHLRPFVDLQSLHHAMVDAVERAPEQQQLKLIHSHPDLAGKAALRGDLSAASSAEQSGAGLGSLTAGELSRFTALNEAYRSRFQFPFIIAVKGLDKYAILDAYEPRLTHDRAVEIATALEQISKIAWLRLSAS